MAFLLLWLLTFTTLSVCIYPPTKPHYTYWIDESCRRPDKHFEKGFNTFRRWARKAGIRLGQNALQNQYFEMLFAPSDFKEHEAMLFFVKRKQCDSFWWRALIFQSKPETLGYSKRYPGLSGIVKEPNNERNRSNYRFYCDNDPQTSNGPSRWKTRKGRKDPRPRRPGFEKHPEREDLDNMM